VHHVGKAAQWKALEDEITGFTRDSYEGRGSPNRADALVWAISDLVIKKGLSAHDLYGEQGLFGTVASATHT
jgi:phage terminase large subunit-like protein